MSNKKMIDRLIYGFMTFLILLNSLTPLTTLAEAVETPALKLESIAKGQADNQLDVKLSATTDKQTVKINASQAIIEQAKLEENGQSTDLQIENNQVIEVPTGYSDGVIHLTLKQEALKDLQQFDLNYQDQNLTYQFPAAPESSSAESSTSSTIDATQSSDEESSGINTTETSETAKQSTETSESKESSKAENKAARADDPTDIRTYFPGGEGTILTGSSMIFIDDEGNVIDPPVGPNTNVRIYYTWSIPEDVRSQINPGDYFDFELPPELIPKNPVSGDLKNDEGEVYATYTVDKDGKIRFTFTDEVQNQSEINGRFFFDTIFNKEHIDGPGDITIHYPVEDDLPPVDVEIHPDTEKSIDKTGHFDRTPNPSSVEWTVDMNQSMKHLSDATITEKWPDGINYKSVEVMELVMNLDGTVKETGRKLNPDEYTVDANGNVTILGDTNKAYRLVYQTDIDESTKPEDGGKVSFTNTAILTDKNDPDGFDAKATVTNNYGKPIEKNMTGYDPNNQQFNWEIKYNYNEKNIPKDQATISDTISDNMDLVDGSIKLYPITFDDQGNEVKGAALEEGTDYILAPNPDGKGFVVKFLNDLDQAVKVEYKTKVDGIVTDPTQVNNSVTTGTGQTDGDKGTAQQQNVIKNLTNVDYSTHKAEWTININKNHYYMEDLILNDTYSPVPGLSMAIKPDLTPDFEILDVTTNKVLTPGTDYDLELVKDLNGNETGFKVVFKGDYQTTHDEFKLTYLTNFDVTLLDPDNPEMDHYKNNMSADWSDQNGGKHHSDDEQDFKPNDPYQLNAQKSGQYNAQTKHITWTIAVNLSGNILSNAQLKDAIKDNQDYVAGSLKIYEAEVQKDGTVVKKEPETVVNDQMRNYEEPSDSNGQTLLIDFPNQVTTTYLIEFETSVDGKIISGSNQYENLAQYVNSGDDRNVIGEVSVKNGGKYVQKAGEQDSQNPDYVNWHAVINPSQSTLDNVVIKDDPTENQVIDQDSIKLYETTVTTDGTVTPNYDKPLTVNKDYTVEVTTDNVTGKQELTIKMLHEIDKAYQLEYRSYITSSAAGNKDTVSNKITVTGDNQQTVSGGDGQDVIVEINHSGGSATGKKGKLTIQKTEADGKTKLTGAHFQLWNTTKTQLLREGDLDANGQITFGSLPYGEYLLFETKAPDGFTISNDLVVGRRITIDENTSANGAAPLTIPNERNKVIFQKLDENGDPIKLGNGVAKGARFKLEKLSVLSLAPSLWSEVPLNPDTTNSEGILQIDSLPLGFYRLTELEAPTGYILDSQPIYFTVYRNSNYQLPTVNVSRKNYQGSAELIKHDNAGNPLSGATFDVIDSQGKKINQTPLVSQDDGKVTIEGLAPGNYKFVETKAPSGYVLNTKEIPFTIADKGKGKPATVTTQSDGSPIELINYQGSAEFIKKDKSGKILEDAEFDVFDAQGKKVNEHPLVSDDKGKVRIDNLAPGDYTFVETKAPEGYMLNKKKIPFTIKASNIGEVPVVEVPDFINYQGSFELTKRNTDGEGLAGAEFTLFKEDKTSIVKKATSDKDGKILFEDLAPGIYYYQETKAPKVTEGSDYVINPALIEVEVDDNAYGKPEIQEVGDFQNFRGKAQITKVGEGGSIAGAEFELYRIENGDQKYVRTAVAPENGILDISGLGAGYYVLKEVQAAPGYILNKQLIYFVVKENADQDTNIDNLDFKNYESGVVGRKVNEQKEALKGAEYQVYKADDKNQPKGNPLPVKDRSNKYYDDSTITTDKKGEIYFQGLEQGHYVIVETKAPDGYIQDTKPHPFDITGQLGKPTKVNLGDFVNYKGSIAITKKNEAGKELKGAEFEIQDEDGNVQNVLDSDGKETKTLVSDKNGKIYATGLAPNKYRLIETKAPSGYLLNTAVTSFKVSAESDGKPETISLADFINYQGSVKMKKVTEDGKNLAGAVFELYKEDQSIGKYTANEAGLVAAGNLEPGDYYFTETKAPTGYAISKEKRKFKITSTSTNKPKTIDLGKFVNKKIPKTPDSSKPSNKTNGSNHNSGTQTGSYPQTNDTKNPWLWIAGIVVIVIAGVIYRRKKE
ncbi:hypothetical protein IGI39_004088 [Enterococcus sp. AZ135]|uniref:SpaA isopeptide-forming pilin-related protein n=1 Tax=unclassified Enterococcus TaxID=2608891 RepID=UPI003F256F32